MEEILEANGWEMYRQNAPSKVKYYRSDYHPALEIWINLKKNSFILYKDDIEKGVFEAKLLLEKIIYYKSP